jgi:electron transfer flavoprotein alpha subunit
MIAVVVVRDGQLPAGAAETVAECAGLALLIGSGTQAATAELAGVATHLRIAEVAGPFRPAAWAAGLAAALASLGSAAARIVLPGSPDGRDLAPRLAHLLARPLWAGAVAVAPGRVDLARLGGRELHRVAPGAAFVATLVPGVRGIVPAHDAPPTVVEPLAVAVSAVPAPAVPDAADIPDPDVAAPDVPSPDVPAPDVTVVEVLPADPATIDLAEAGRIVAGGAGLDDRGRMDQLGRIAALIGASVGATRVVTDRGWIPHERQIGTTGVVVDPDLYLAFAISGAVQHVSGLGDPRHVISVNTDGHCPMMQLADIAITADANATLDALEQSLTTRKVAAG